MTNYNGDIHHCDYGSGVLRSSQFEKWPLGQESKINNTLNNLSSKLRRQFETKFMNKLWGTKQTGPEKSFLRTSAVQHEETTPCCLTLFITFESILVVQFLAL